MNVDELFERFEPPPGGSERFARRLEEEANVPIAARWRGLALAAAATFAAMAVAVTVLVTQRQSDSELPLAELRPTPVIYDSPAFDRLLGRPLQTTELTARINEQPITLTELESQNEKVRIYRIN